MIKFFLLYLVAYDLPTLFCFCCLLFVAVIFYFRLPFNIEFCILFLHMIIFSQHHLVF